MFFLFNLYTDNTIFCWF